MAAESTNSFHAGGNSTSLEVHLLGLVDFDSALFLQERLVYEISGRLDTQGALLICEHPPLITVGREGSRSHIHADSDELERRELAVRWLNRGGGCCVHAPGQLAIYPILPLDRLEIGLREFRDRCERAVAAACRDQRLKVTLSHEAPGVWGRSGQLAFFGAGVRSWVTHHGLFLNVSPKLDLLRIAQWCGGNAVTSLTAQRMRRVPMPRVREAVVRRLTEAFNYALFHVYTGHPLLRRTTRKVNVYA